MTHPSSRVVWGLALAVSMTASTGAARAGAAPAAEPATAPSTTPAVVLDQSSPKSLLRSFYASRGEVDEATIRSLLHAANPIEQQVLDAVVQVELANARLRAARREKFGPSAGPAASLASATTGPAVAPPSSSPSASSPSQGLDVDTVENIEALTEKIEGDRATLVASTEPKIKMEFVRVDGTWKLPVSAHAGVPIDAGVAESLSGATRAQVEIIDAVAADVRAGKFASEDQVRQELSRRFAERLASATRPASQSATQPAGT